MIHLSYVKRHKWTGLNLKDYAVCLGVYKSMENNQSNYELMPLAIIVKVYKTLLLY